MIWMNHRIIEVGRVVGFLCCRGFHKKRFKCPFCHYFLSLLKKRITSSIFSPVLLADWALETSAVVPGISSQGVLYASLLWEFPLPPSVLWEKAHQNKTKNQHINQLSLLHIMTSWWKTDTYICFTRSFSPFFHSILDYAAGKHQDWQGQKEKKQQKVQFYMLRFKKSRREMDSHVLGPAQYNICKQG